MDCPRCSATMGPAQLGEVSYQRCAACGGGVVRLPELNKALAGLEPLLPTPDLDTAMGPLPDPGGHVPCPGCGARMSQGSYLEQGLVTIDRCVSCMLLFADMGELEAMAEQRLRSEAQRSLSRRRSEAVLQQMKWLVSGADV